MKTESHKYTTNSAPGVSMDIDSIWKAVLTDLELSVSSVNFSTWIKPLVLKSLQDAGERRVATILCPAAYHQQMLETRYHGQVQLALERITESKIEIATEVGKRQVESSRQEAPLFAEPSTLANSLGLGSGKHNLNPRLTFDTYVVGSSNNFAYAAAQGVSKSPGTRYNPLFIYGGVGLGKTHLMHAVGHVVYKDHPDWDIMYLSAETFGSDLISSLQNKKTAQFKKKYRTPNVLLIDDVQFIAGKEYIQEEFFHTFNELYMSQRQIILTSDRPPQEISRLEERLSSRFMGGLMVDVQTPDFETRVAILTQKCQSLGINVPSEALSIIAERTATNIRELEGTLQMILSKAMATGGEVTSEIVREFLGAEQERRTQRVRPSTIITKTAQYFSFKPSELTGNSRKAPLTTARHAAMYVLYKDLDIPYEQIGMLFGGRDHTTVMHAVDKIAERLKTDPSMGKIIADLKHGL